MRTPSVLRIFIISMFAIFACSPTLQAQDIEGGASRQDLGSGRSNFTRLPRLGTSPPRVITKTKLVTPTTGAISVSAEPNADLHITPVNIPRQEPVDVTVPSDERGWSVPKLKPGTYHVKAELAGYTTVEKDVRVTQNDITNVTLNLRPKIYTVTFKTTNVKSGEVRYAPVAEVTDSGGAKRYNPTGTTMLAQIENGMAKLPNLKAGLYGVDIRTEEVGYEKLLGKFELPADKTEIEVKLNKKLSDKTLAANWSAFKNTWDAPGNWNAAMSGLTVNGPGIAVPHNDDYRYYADFEMTSDVKLSNGVGVSFVVHEQDLQNYYLIQLTGPKADERYVLRGFIVRNGSAQRFGESQPINVFSSTLSAQTPFTVSLKMTGNRIEVWIQDNDSGSLQPAGALTDQNSQFRLGAVGIGVHDNEQFVVNSFMVCKQCPK